MEKEMPTKNNWRPNRLLNLYLQGACRLMDIFSFWQGWELNRRSEKENSEEQTKDEFVVLTANWRSSCCFWNWKCRFIAHSFRGFWWWREALIFINLCQVSYALLHFCGNGTGLSTSVIFKTRCLTHCVFSVYYEQCSYKTIFLL